MTDPTAHANAMLVWEAQKQQDTKVDDSPVTFARVWSEIKGPLIEAALPFRAPLPMPATPRPRIGFYLASAALLAHTVNLRTFLSGLAQIDAPIEAFVYVSQPESVEFSRAFPDARYCIATTPLKNWQKVRQRSTDDRLSAMVFVSNPMGMAFASTMGVAPRHIWWAHKWHGLRLPHVDGYLDACHPLHDRSPLADWIGCYTALPAAMREKPYMAAVAAIRAAAPGSGPVFGTCSRTAKITAEFLETVVRILIEAPDAFWLLASDRLPAAAEAVLAPVKGRWAYLGWVDVHVWSRAIDAYLDTFPFAGGHAVFEAMAAAKPVVWMKPAASHAEQSFPAELLAMADPGIPLPWAHDKDAYVAAALAYIARADVAAQDGARNSALIEGVMSDEKRMAASVSRAILDVIKA
jgi:hypothetical protein